MEDRIFAIGEELSNTMPTPQEHAIEAAENDDVQTVQPQPTATGGLLDRFGRGFDPNIHVTDDLGNPKLTATGGLRVRRGQSPSYVGGATSSSEPRRSPDALAAGQAIADAIIGSAHMMLGDDWAPRVDPATGMNERLAMGAAWGRYFEATGMRDIPPGWAITIVMVSYAMPRMAQPKTQTKLTQIGAWLKDKGGRLYYRWKGRKSGNVVVAENRKPAAE